MAATASIPTPTFDIEGWSSNYSGPLLPYRLAHIAANCPSLATHALGLALEITKRGKDTNIYRLLVELASALGKAVEEDVEWVARQDDANRRELSRLESELRGYKNNLIRESIRMGQEDLATHHLLTGGPQAQSSSDAASSVTNTTHPSQGQMGLSAAYTAFGRMRDYCTTPAHVAGMMLRLLFVALVQGVSAPQVAGSAATQFGIVNTHANRLRSIGLKEEEQARLDSISVAAAGIALLAQSKYSDAATHFLSVPLALTADSSIYGFDFCRFVAGPNDIAVYGGLTALATLSRDDLKETVLGGSFRDFLELEPHMRKAITLFTTGKYRACLDTLQRYHADWSLDVYLGAGIDSTRGSHVDRLFSHIRERSITAYFSSFSQVSLTSLSATFPPLLHTSTSSPAATMQAELIPLIESGTLRGRLDVVNGLLIAPSSNINVMTHRSAQEAAEEVERTLLQRLHRVNVTLARLEVARSKGQGSIQVWPEHIRV